MDETREKREWWALFDGKVMRVTGYSCAPNNPGAWWCPEMGYTLNEGFQLFTREDEALRLAISFLTTSILDAEGTRARYRQRLAD
jgi:hypothetical protein